MKSRAIQLALALASIGICLAAWEMFALTSPTLVPDFWEVAVAARDLFAHEDIHVDMWATVRRTLVAFLIAVATGVPLGLAIGAVPTVRTLLSGPLDFLRSIPAFVLLPLALAMLKSGDIARIGIAVFGAGVVMVASTAFGTAHLKTSRVEVAQVYGASPFFVLAVIVRGLLPAIADGARISLSLSLILITVAEIMLGATHGLGTRVNDSLSGFDLPKMYALVFLIGLVGYSLNLVARKCAERWAGYGRHL